MPDPNESLATGFQPSPIQVGPGGEIVPIPVREESREFVNLCELGPCMRYHELRTKLDAQDPQDGSKGDTYLTTTRTCYPAPGIEFDVSLSPVRDCTLWEPRVDVQLERLRHREHYKNNNEAEVAQFEASWPKK